MRAHDLQADLAPAAAAAATTAAIAAATAAIASAFAAASAATALSCARNLFNQQQGIQPAAMVEIKQDGIHFVNHQRLCAQMWG